MHPIQFLVDQLMLPILDKAYMVIGSYGWAIVLLTLIIKMVLLPLTMQSYFSMKEMQKLQPKLKRIQERYKNKPEELNKQIMALYKEHKVNPLGGCLPMLVQMPFLFALYASLMSDKFKAMLAASGDSSFLVLSDLSKMGVFNDGSVNIDNLIMVLIFGVTTFIQQKVMTPQSNDDNSPQAAMQKNMAKTMPIMITGMFLFFPVPSGVFLYLVVSNLIGIAQYSYLTQKGRETEAREKAELKAQVAVQSEPVDEPEPAALESAEKAEGNKKYKVKKATKKKKKRK